MSVISCKKPDGSTGWKIGEDGQHIFSTEAEANDGVIMADAMIVAIAGVESVSKAKSTAYLETVANKLKTLPQWVRDLVEPSARGYAGGKAKGARPDKPSQLSVMALASAGNDDIKALNDDGIKQFIGIAEAAHYHKLAINMDVVRAALSEARDRGLKLAKTKHCTLLDDVGASFKAIVKAAVASSVDGLSSIGVAGALEAPGCVEFVEFVCGSEETQTAVAKAVEPDYGATLYFLYEFGEVDRLATVTKFGASVGEDYQGMLSLDNGVDADTAIAEWIDSMAVEGTVFDNSANIVAKADERHLVYGILMEPEEVDTQGEIVDAATIEKAAHAYMLDSQMIGLQHSKESKTTKIVESFIAPQDVTINKALVKAGSWVLVVKVLDNNLWGDIKKGKYTGFSVGGFAARQSL